MIRFIWVCAIVMVLAGCGTENPFSRGYETVDDNTINPVPGEEASFALHVIPALQTCTSCHRSGAGGWTYGGGENAFAEVLDVIDRNDPAGSDLLIYAIGGENHGGGTIFSSSSNEYLAILQWIEEGALDN